MSRSWLRLTPLIFALVATFAPGAVSEEAIEDNAQSAEQVFEKMYLAVREYLGPNDILVPPNILARAELGDHFETINPDRPDKGNAFGNPKAHIFGSVTGSDAPENDGGTFGDPNGGGRRLMVTHPSVDLTAALMKWMSEGLDRKPGIPTESQSKVLVKAIQELGSENFDGREGASEAIVKVGVVGIPTLEEALKSNRDPEVAIRLRTLIRKLSLADVLARFRAAHPDEKK